MRYIKYTAVNEVQPVIMAGGFGARLWPISKPNYPKQFSKFIDGLSLFQQTVIRNAIFAQPIIIINKAHLQIAIEQIRDINVECQIIVEQEMTGTAICGMIAALSQANKSCIALLPADHNIVDYCAYRQNIIQATKFTKSFDVVTIGVEPNYPNEHYGYIQCAQKIAINTYVGRRFIEKPSQEQAKSYLSMKNFLWNSGIFLYQPQKFLDTAKALSPQLFDQATKVWGRRINCQKLIYLPENQGLGSDSFDKAFAEKLSRFAVLRADFGWNDLGTLRNLFEVLAHTPKLNHLSANTYVSNDVRQCWIMHDKKLAVVMGIKEVCVINNDDYLIISSYDKLDELGQKLQMLRKLEK